jgi:gluconokinase
VVDEVRTDKRARTWCYYLGAGRWVAGAAINNAGLVYAWLRDQVEAAANDGTPLAADGGRQTRREITPEDLNRWAEGVPAGSDGLLFLPYLAGERSPNWNAQARGLLIGLSLAHTYRHLARATLEGVGYRMRTIFEPMLDVAGAPTEIRAAGGFTRSPLWLQIVADVLGQPLALCESPEASALGAAQLAMLGAGIVARFEDLAPLVRTGDTVAPDASRHALYGRLYAIYQRVYEHVSADFPAIADIQAELAGPAAAGSQAAREGTIVEE